MIINIRNEISKSFFFINIKPPFLRKEASQQELYIAKIYKTIEQVEILKLIFIC